MLNPIEPYLMNITTELKENNRLVINGVNLGEYTDEQLKDLVKSMDFIAHHKHNLYEVMKDHYKITIRDIDMGTWEVSQLRHLIQKIDKL